MSQRASHEMDLDSFLGHKGTAGGSSGYLAKWKEDGQVDVFLHPRAGVAALWGHSWYRIADYKKKDEQIVEVRSKRLNCLESEAVLLRQKYRDNDDRRETPPVLCPYCKTLEFVRDLVVDGKVSWVDPAFTFEVPDDPSQDAIVLHAGGWTKLIGSKKKSEYSKEELGELRKAGIALDEVYLEEGAARLQYLLSVIPVADPEQGCVLTFEAQALGAGIQKVIRNKIMAEKERGDLRLHPYAMRWLYDANKSFSAKYDVVPMVEIPITPAIRDVMNQPPPSIAEHVLPLNVRELRASMEEHCEIHELIPWDDLFGPAMAIADELEAEAQAAGVKRDEEATSFGYGANARTPEVQGPAGEAVDPDELVECENCKEAMKASASTCPHCKCTYLPDGTMVPPQPAQEAAPPPKPPMRSRAEVAASRAQPAAASAVPPAPAGGEVPAAAGTRFRASARRRSVG